MKTLVDIDEKLLNEALKITSAHTKKEVVNLSLLSFAKLIGTSLPLSPTPTVSLPFLLQMQSSIKELIA